MSDPKPTNRTMIGEAPGSGTAYGMPLMAFAEADSPTTTPRTTIRFRKQGRSFVLEQWQPAAGDKPARWEEVPVVL